MLVTIPIVLGLVASASARCGTRKPTEEIKAFHASSRAKEAGSAKLFGDRAAYAEIINTYIHIITDGDDGKVDVGRITQQVDVLNSKYKSTGLSFKLVQIDEINNPAWRSVAEDSPQELDMKSFLRKGDYRDLNIYLDSIQPDGDFILLGYSTFPAKNADKQTFNLDGVVLDPTTLPGGVAPYDEGITAVHEVGHWFSLFHPFEPHDNTGEYAGCYGEGDYIFDTPAEASAAYGCMVGRDTCTGTLQSNNHDSEPGTDPIHNYMDYSDDSCLNTFSAGQIKRMQTSYTNLRKNYVKPS